MSDIRLFTLSSDGGIATEVDGDAMSMEGHLHSLFEKNLKKLLGIDFLGSEYPISGGSRIDTIGLDENDRPVIIEYKRHMEEGAITQASSYLNQLKKNSEKFTLLVIEEIGLERSKSIKFDATRVICVAADFSRHARNAAEEHGFELIRYRYFENNSLMLEFVTPTVSKPGSGGNIESSFGIVEKIRTLFDEGRGITGNKEMLEHLKREGVQFHLPTVQTVMSKLRRKHGVSDDHNPSESGSGIVEKVRTLFDEGRGITDNKEMLEHLKREGVQFHLPTVQTQMSRLRRKHRVTRTR